MMDNKKDEININKPKKQTPIFFLIAFLTIIIMCTNGLFPLPKSGYTNMWSMCNWGLSYRSGFIIRGLAGTLMTAIVGAITFKQIYICGIILFTVLMASYIIININLYRKSQRIAAFVLMAFLMVQPSNARWLMTSVMFTRLDNFVFIFAIISMFVIYKFDGIKMYAVVLFLSVVAILIHEYFAVAFSSLLFSLMLMKESKRIGKASLRPLFVYYMPILIFFVIVILTGGTELSSNEFIPSMQQNLAEEGMKERIVSVAQEVVMADMADKRELVKLGFTKDKRDLMILTYVVLSPTLILIAGMMTKLLKSSKEKFEKLLLILITGSCFAPLTASFIAVDHFRWIGYLIFCLSAAIVFLYFLNENNRETILNYVEKNAPYFIAASIVALLFGTLNDVNTMPLIENIYYNRILVIPEFFQ